MEFCLEESIPTYAGGLGVLAGDVLRSAADMEFPMVGVSLLYRKGYIGQRLDQSGNQSEYPVGWDPVSRLEKVESNVSVEIEGRRVQLAVWRYTVKGGTGGIVPVYLLDSDVDGNAEEDRGLTNHLYGGDLRYRLCQEVLLGVGGADLLLSLHEDVAASHRIVWHVNEGHAAFLTLRLLEERLRQREPSTGDPGAEDLKAVRDAVVFTTHTPVPAGHDVFGAELTGSVLGDERMHLLDAVFDGDSAEVNMTKLALRMSHYANGVSMRHGAVSRLMFPGVKVDAVTNGVHVGSWVSAPFATLFDQHLGHWRRDNRYLRHAVGIPLYDVLAAHAESKSALLREITERTGVKLQAGSFTIGFARRATPYKRADLIFSDVALLRSLARKHGTIQLVFAGKAHPHDEPGKELIRRIVRSGAAVEPEVRVVYLEGYDLALGRLLTCGVDLWLNNPIRPLEASGTSGMKAALNGVPSLSILDGWWVEGHIEGVTGWSIGDDPLADSDPSEDAHELYYKLDKVILPMFYGAQQEWAKVMRNAIAINGSYFNTQRMLLQYQMNAYRTSG
jgi:starch phosphorylase